LTSLKKRVLLFFTTTKNMNINIPPQLLEKLKNDAATCGMDTEQFISAALYFYFDRVSDTQQDRIAYTTHETAVKLGLSTKTILRLVARGLLKPLPDSTRRFVFGKQEIERYVADATGRSPQKKGSPASRQKRGNHTRRH
jgi:hypothetical protein